MLDETVEREVITSESRFQTNEIFEQMDARPTQDDDEDGGVDIVLSQEVEVVLGLDLAPGAEADEDAAGDGEEEVDEHHEVLDHAVTAVLHPGAGGRLSEIRQEVW